MLASCFLSDSIIIELRTPMYQRVYQYLKFFQARDFVSLDNFVFIGTLDKGYTDRACLSTIIKYTKYSVCILLLLFLTIDIPILMILHGKRYVTLFGF